MTIPHPATLPKDYTTFHFKKAWIRGLSIRVHQGQSREDLTGKFAIKLSRIQRALSSVGSEIEKDKEALLLSHAERYPEGMEHAGEPIPKKIEDKNGNKVEVPGQYMLKNEAKAMSEVEAMLDEYVTVSCPGILETELEQFKSISGDLVEAFMFFEVGGEYTTHPKEAEPSE